MRKVYSLPGYKKFVRSARLLSVRSVSTQALVSSRGDLKKTPTSGFWNASRRPLTWCEILRSEPSLPKRFDICDSPVFRAQFIDRVSDRAAEVVLDALKKGHIPARARILEVGCGNGRFLRALGTRDGAHGLRVSGVDILEADLGLARAHGGAPRLPWFPPAAPARP